MKPPTLPTGVPRARWPPLHGANLASAVRADITAAASERPGEPAGAHARPPAHQASPPRANRRRDSGDPRRLRDWPMIPS
jgi:hypothetical protein